MKIGVPSLEFMEFQNDSFFKDLTKTIHGLRNQPLNTKTLYQSGIETLIFNRLGMRVEFQVIDSSMPNASMSMPSMDKNHIFLRPFTEFAGNDVGKFISYLNDDRNRIGIVDLEKIRVGGVFSQISMQLKITTGHFNDYFTDGEIASTILHEIGHGFTYFYYLLHISMGSYVTTAIAAATAGAKGDKERVVIIEKGMRVMGIDGVAVRDFLTQTPEQISATLQTLYVNSTINNLRSETGFGMYEIRAAEQLADWFAVRFGAGYDSATCQEKLYRDFKKIVLANTARTRLTLQTAMVYGAYFIQFTIPFPKLISELLNDDNISRYDKDSDRVKYIRQNMIDMLKDAQLVETTRKEMLKQIDAIKEIELRIAKDESPVFPSISNFIKRTLVPNWKRHKNVVEVQKTIEELLYNESYVAAAKFQGVTK